MSCYGILFIIILHLPISRYAETIQQARVHISTVKQLSYDDKNFDHFAWNILYGNPLLVHYIVFV